MVRMLFGAILPEQKGELERHLVGCAACRSRLKSYDNVRRAICKLEPERVPPEAVEACELAAREGQARKGKRPKAPADPRAMRGWLYRAAVLAAVLLSVALVNGVILWLASGSYEAQPDVGRVLWRSGRVEVSYSGGRSWVPLNEGAELVGGAALRTGEDGLLKIKTQAAAWWLDRSSAILLSGPRRGRLLSGRCFVERSGTPGEPVRLESPQGTAACIEGSFVASVSPLRSFLTVTAGKAIMESSAAESLEVLGNQAVVAIQGCPVEPVRETDVRLATHWLRRFEIAGRCPLSMEEVARLPLRPAQHALPDAVLLHDVTLRLIVRGPMALASVEAGLKNEGEAAWQGALDAADLFYPGALCTVPSEPVELPPGGLARVHSYAVLVLQRRGAHWRLAVMPQGWTRRLVERFSLEVEGRASGGFATAECLTHPLRLECQASGVSGSYEANYLEPEPPVVLDFAFRQEQGCELFVFGSEDAAQRYGLVACRGLFKPAQSGAEVEKYLLAFDATADYGSAGRTYAHELVEELVNRVPASAEVGFVAYDGKVKRLPETAKRYEAPKLEKMLTALWSLQGIGRAAPGALFQQLMQASAGTEDAVLFYVTGNDEPPSVHGPAGGAKAFCVQVGVDDAREFYRTACSASGGAAVGAGALHPEAAAAELFRDMKWEGLTSARIEVEEGGRALKVLSRPGDFSNRPLLFLVAISEGARLRGRFVATTAHQTSDKHFALAIPKEGMLEPELAAKMLEADSRDRAMRRAP